MLELIKNKSKEILDFDNFFEDILKEYDKKLEKKDNIKKRINGIYHTPYKLAKKIVKDLMESESEIHSKTFLEPCVGLGSFLFAYLEFIFDKITDIDLKTIKNIEKNIYIAEWDKEALSLLIEIYYIFLEKKYNIFYSYDSPKFNIANESIIYDKNIEEIDICKAFGKKIPEIDYIITNPPYYTLRYVDRDKYNDEEKRIMTSQIEKILKVIDKKQYKFISKKNTNLYEVFVEEIVKNFSHSKSKIGLLIPNSFLTNSTISNMRKYIFKNFSIERVQSIQEKVSFYPVGQSMTILIINKDANLNKSQEIQMYNLITKEEELFSNEKITLNKELIELISDDYKLINLSSNGFKVLKKIHSYPKLKEIEFIENRRGEIDLTKWKAKISEVRTFGSMYLVKGRDLVVYEEVKGSCYINEVDEKKIELSKNYRIVCNQISNMKTKDRLKFSLVKDCLLGNSCNYLMVEDFDELLYLLGVMNSTLMEWRFRITNGNNHISNYELNELPINFEKDEIYETIIQKIKQYMMLSSKDLNLLKEVDDLVFRKYNLNYEDKSYIFKEMDIDYTYNHYYHKLSDLDMEIISAIKKEGDNWEVLPEIIINKSERLKKIKQTGGRTTLYARLRSDRPSYTMNTYINRPGNGAHIHPKENRVITSREAARFQCFPDSYKFLGTKGAILNQIGNAIPSLLIHCLIEKIKNKIELKTSIDLFCGAGGSKIGANMSNIKTFVANDIDSYACQTYKYNNPEVKVINGDITLEKIKEEIIESVDNQELDLIIGGPPCQGFSLAGKRDVDDERNKLFLHFADLVERLEPKVLIMENVPGILSMNKGETFKEIKESFSELGYCIFAKKLLAANYGVPQLRERVFLVGIKTTLQNTLKLTETDIYPDIICQSEEKKSLFLNKIDYVSVNDAINDLVTPSENKDEILISKTDNLSNYQKLMKGHLSATQYLKNLK